MDTFAIMLVAAGALLLGFVVGSFFGYSKGVVDGFTYGCKTLEPKRGPNGRFIKKG